MSVKSSSGARKTIGVFSAHLTRVWGAEFMAGVMDAAEAADTNVVCVVGGKPVALPVSDDLKTSYGLYDMIKPGQFDGLLFTADLAHGISAEEMSQFCQAFSSTPIVAHAIQADGIPNLMTDNLEGMRAMIRHLVEVHKYKRIAFICGPKGQIESDLRFQAYQEELKAHGIRFEPRLVMDGDFTPESGRAAVRTLMERGVRYQAIAAANDRMAFGAMEILQQRGIQVPDQIALTGFDDISEAQSVGVPLTTVRQPFYEAGQQTFEALLKRINGETLPPVKILPASLIVRWSCGCLPESVQRAVVLPKEVARTGKLENKREAAIRALFATANIPENDLHAEEFHGVYGRMWDAFLVGLHDDNASDAFMKMVQSVIEVLQKHGRDVATWHNIISTLRKHALGSITSPTTSLRAENLFQQARMLAGELSQRAQAYRRLEIEQQEELLSAFGFSMAPAMSLEEIGNAISNNFPALGIGRWYVMFYSDVSTPRPVSAPPPSDYRLFLQYDRNKFEIPDKNTKKFTGRLVPPGKMPEDQRYSAIVMPLTLARNRFGFMWVEIGPHDWEVYMRVRNLISSALLRTMLVQQREQAQKEIERLLEDARQRAEELAIARDTAEKAAQENARMYESEQSRRQAVEIMASSSRQLSLLSKVEDVPQQILEQLSSIVQFDRGVVFLEDVNGAQNVAAHHGLPDNAPLSELRYTTQNNDKITNMYRSVARMKEPIHIGDVSKMQGWSQPDWLPMDRSWLGLPLFHKNKMMGMVVLTRSKAWAFTRDDAIVTRAFSVQAAIALENAQLYKDVTSMNEMMERMVEQRVEELNNALLSLEKLDKNKSTFIQIAAHELRTPLTVIKGYLGMLRANPAVQAVPSLVQAVEGVMLGTNRLHQIVNSMLDVARLENQIVTPHFEVTALGPILRLIQKEYVDDLTARNLTLSLDEGVQAMPLLMADSQLLRKALDQVIVNAIKFTPDGGSITVDTRVVSDDKLGQCAEISVKDTGIGIDPSNHKIIFEKLYQLGKVEFHSSSRISYKGGGPGLGLAIAAGIVKAHQGKIWVESEGHDEEKFPGSTFFIRIPLAK